MAQQPIQQIFDLALKRFQAGQLGDSEQLCRQILARQPGNSDALHLLGLIAFQAGHNDAAVDFLRQAISLNPNNAPAHKNLGNALNDKGSRIQAIAAYRLAISLRPGFVEAHANLATTLWQAGQHEQAIAEFRQAISLKPDSAETYSNLGNALREMKEVDEAIAQCSNAIALKPDLAEAHNNLGSALVEKHHLDEAITAFRRAIELKPDYAEAHQNLGSCLNLKDMPNDAVIACRRAIALRPDFAEAHANLAYALAETGRTDQAVEEYRRAISLNPDFADAHKNLGSVLREKGRLAEAVACFRQAMWLRPQSVKSHDQLLTTLYYTDFDTPAIAAELGRWAKQHAQPLRRFIQPHFNDRTADRRLRLGYVSSDFCNHSSAYFLLPLLENHDPRKVELYCYSQVLRPDAMTERMKGLFAVCRSTVELSDEELDRQIREDHIDILVDLKLHTANNRLLVFARKPAPVQVTWLGYPGSTGLAAIDYRLSDPYLDPPGMDESIYSEKTIRLPDSFWCYNPLAGREIAVSSLPALANGWVTFGCLNNFCKINDPLLRLWARVLRTVPNSRLLLLSPEGDHRQHLLELLGRENIAPERIEIVTSRQPTSDYMRLYNRIDIGLDPIPVNGHTTTLDSFWMGVPVVTLAGPTALGRAGVSHLMNLGLPDFIASTPDKYVEIASTLANDLGHLQSLRSTLREKMEHSPLMDGPRFARNMESAFIEMWQKWCNQEPNQRPLIASPKEANPPNFFIIGAPKAATTSLSSLLEHHPQAAIVNKKEQHFFSLNDKYEGGWDEYLTQFEHCTGRKAIGDASTSYCIIRCHPKVVDRIKLHVPDAKIIYMVRHPIERMESHYVEILGTEGSVRSESINDAVQREPAIVDSGRYWETFDAYRKQFGESRIKVIWFEEYIANPVRVFQDVCRFLEIDDTVVPDVSKQRINSRGKIPRRLVEIGRGDLKIDTNWDPDLRRAVIDEIREDNLRFLAHFGKDKTYWGDVF